MLINLRNALMAGKRLPYDAEVEYLESTGTQYINTGISGAEHNLIITARVRINTFGAYAGAFGNYAAESANSFRLILSGLNNGQAYANCGYISSSSHVITNFSLGDWHTVVLNGAEDRCSCDGVEFTKAGRFIRGAANANTIRIFTSGGPAAGTWSKQISAFKVELNGVLVRDFIPVRKGTVGYLYDRVSGKLFGNAGTGDFVLGPDVVPVEYIESHGTEWIDTGYIPNQQTRWELDYQFFTIGLGSNGMFQENPTVRFNIGQGTDRFFNISYGANNALNIASDTLRHLFVADIPNLQWRLDSSSGAFPAPVSTALQYSLRIFCRNSPGGTVYNRHSGRCFASRMYQSDVLSQRLLPVRVGTEGAMMDVLTRRIYRNQGTGAFAYGNDLKYPIPAS